MRILNYLIGYIFKAVVFASILSVLGIIFSLFKGWSFMKGAYLFVLGGGGLTIFFSIFLLIGTPQMRRSIHFDTNRAREARRGGEGIGPALMGIVMIIIGFWLEALTH